MRYFSCRSSSHSFLSMSYRCMTARASYRRTRKRSGGYYNIGGKIYLHSLNLAPYELEVGTDAASFRALDTGRYSYTNVGMDVSSVFCGARKMSGLDPART
ncbi:hypothetical protein [Campylobacter showae]|uniref:hypothetical protein n=1 Tax=Campylobacter showae TaxID=204 RepID=UPI00142F19F8|nr:hypothetical protein [Campylobacter showae]